MIQWNIFSIHPTKLPYPINHFVMIVFMYNFRLGGGGHRFLLKWKKLKGVVLATT
jgi:hypothetical protein